MKAYITCKVCLHEIRMSEQGFAGLVGLQDAYDTPKFHSYEPLLEGFKTTIVYVVGTVSLTPNFFNR